MPCDPSELPRLVPSCQRPSLSGYASWALWGQSPGRRSGRPCSAPWGGGLGDPAVKWPRGAAQQVPESSGTLTGGGSASASHHSTWILCQAAPCPSFLCSWDLDVIKFANEWHVAGRQGTGEGPAPDAGTALSPGCFLLFLPESRSEIRPGAAVW